MKGIFQLRPPQPRYTKTLDVNKVLSWLKSLGRNDSLSLKQLALKIAALLTILAGRRIHTLYMLSVIHMDQSLDKVIFHIIGLTKCSKPIILHQLVVCRAYVEDEKRNLTSSIANLVHELPHELPNDLRLRILGNTRKNSNLGGRIALFPVSLEEIRLWQ